MVWHGLIWYGMVWYGTLWCGMVWCGMVWYGSMVAWRTILGSPGTHRVMLGWGSPARVWRPVALEELIIGLSYGMIRYGMTWYGGGGVAWRGVVWRGVAVAWCGYGYNSGHRAQRPMDKQ